MKTSQKGIELIKQFEGFRLKGYLDSVNIPTIGYGTTVYPNGEKVKLSDVISKKKAEEYLINDVKKFEDFVNKYVVSDVNQNQFDALVSFTYNVGPNNLQKSTLLKKVNKNPNDPSISKEFLKWVNAGGNKIQGLVNRRNEEAKLYFTK